METLTCLVVHYENVIFMSSTYQCVKKKRTGVSLVERCYLCHSLVAMAAVSEVPIILPAEAAMVIVILVIAEVLKTLQQE